MNVSKNVFHCCRFIMVIEKVSYIFETAKYISKITVIIPSQKDIPCTHSSNKNKLNFTSNFQNNYFCKVAPDL